MHPSSPANYTLSHALLNSRQEQADKNSLLERELGRGQGQHLGAGERAAQWIEPIAAKRWGRYQGPLECGLRGISISSAVAVSNRK